MGDVTPDKPRRLVVNGREYVRAEEYDAAAVWQQRCYQAQDEVIRLREALREIRDTDPVDMALDQWVRTD